MLASRLHGKCHLCQANIGLYTKDTHDSPKSFWEATPLVCPMCDNGLLQPPIFRLSHDDISIPLYVGGYYHTPLDKVMTQFKDHHDLSALMVLYHLLSKLSKPTTINASNAVIVPVPTTKSRLSKRGFNPVLILAKYLSHLWQIPLFTQLYRHDNQTHQRGLSKAERTQNVADDFYINQHPNAHHIVLFDDVITTGSTLLALANTLSTQQNHLYGVGVLHGKPDLHLPILTKDG